MLAQRLPELDSGANRLAERLEATTTGFERVEAQVATIQAQAPELALWLEAAPGAGAGPRGPRASLGERGAEITTARRARLARPAGRCHRRARGGSGAGQAAGRRSRASSRSGACRRAAGERAGQSGGRTRSSKRSRKADALLSKLAEQTDGAVKRSEEIVQRAEAEVARRLETATEQAIDGLSQAREAQLAELKTWASRSRRSSSRPAPLWWPAGVVWTRQSPSDSQGVDRARPVCRDLGGPGAGIPQGPRRDRRPLRRLRR